MANEYIKIKLPTEREIYINKNNVTVISQDPMSPKTKTEVYMSDGIRYVLSLNVLDVLKLFDVSSK